MIDDLASEFDRNRRLSRPAQDPFLIIRDVSEFRHSHELCQTVIHLNRRAVVCSIHWVGVAHRSKFFPRRVQPLRAQPLTVTNQSMTPSGKTGGDILMRNSSVSICLCFRLELTLSSLVRVVYRSSFMSPSYRSRKV